ncbi:unnamed protein product [Cylicocyclus nassatus]|uniref:C-type lectin domain-containing protein n=1 Tax=Cylicocyclus nassatus TaxID=53992 RepID=A0AA36HC16_CYLNA|nr:unnamed protein product [Cylicocyclus nassatus]
MLLSARCTFLMVILALISVTESSCKGWREFQGYEYKLMEGPLVFWEAEQSCVREHAHLASIHSEKENKFVFSLTTPKGMTLRDNAWIGLYRVESDWQWTDDTKVDYLHWSVDDPNNAENSEYCVFMFEYELKKYKNGYWGDWGCHIKTQHHICKRRARHGNRHGHCNDCCR